MKFGGGNGSIVKASCRDYGQKYERGTRRLSLSSSRRESLRTCM